MSIKSSILLLMCAAIGFCDTIPYINSGCLRNGLEKVSMFSDTKPLTKTVALKNDSLIFSGEIYANCCGTHKIAFSKVGTNFSFEPIDIPENGHFCACFCVYTFRLALPGCREDEYNVKFSSFYGDSIRTIVSRYPTKTVNHFKTAGFGKQITHESFDLYGRVLNEQKSSESSRIIISRDNNGTIRKSIQGVSTR